MTTPLPKIVELNFVKLRLYQNYAYLTIKEGVAMDLPKVGQLFEVFEEHFPDKNFGYISDRQHDFSVDPVCYMEISAHPRLKSIAILCHKESSYHTAEFEKSFYKRPFGAFYSQEECEDWIRLNLQ